MASPDRTHLAYDQAITKVSFSVLAEVFTILGAYRDALVLVGGWVPYFLLKRHQRADDLFQHVGSIDIDLAVDGSKVDSAQYATMERLLRERQYDVALDIKGKPIPNCYERRVQLPVGGESVGLRVDFLTPPASGKSDGHRHVEIQDGFLARKAKGCEAAFRFMTNVEIAATLPEGGQVKVNAQMADLAGCVTMKDIVLGERFKEKDAYDVYALAAHVEGGPKNLAEVVKPHRNDSLVKEALVSIGKVFDAREANGPAWVAAFLQPASPIERERLITDAFMVVQEFCRLVEEG